MFNNHSCSRFGVWWNLFPGSDLLRLERQSNPILWVISVRHMVGWHCQTTTPFLLCDALTRMKTEAEYFS